MKVAICELESESPLSFSKYYKVPELAGEGKGEYEERTWRERIHADAEGNVFIPPMMVKNCLSEAAKYLGIQRPGKGKQNYTKHFEAGIMVTEPALIGIKKNDIQFEWLHGKRGGSTRVPKCFPLINSWKATVKVYIVDDTVTEKDGSGRNAFEHHLEEAGRFIGFGRFRPRKNGYYGRFKVNSIKWVEE
jgi:hypothetical protein